MAADYSIRAELSAKDTGFTSTVGKARASLAALGGQIKSGFSFGVLTGAGQAAFSAITSGVRGLISEIDSSNAAWKNFEANLQIVGATSGEIDSAKSALQEYAQQTVYSASDMASTFAQLAAVGTKNTAELVKGFGGLAAAAEDPQQAMKTLSMQATQMAAKPTVAWEDFKLMLEQTPAGIAAVAKQMGMSSAEMVGAIQSGTIATDDFFAAIEAVGNSDAFSEMATTPKTVGQALDGLKETVSTGLTPAFDVLSQVGIDAVESIAAALGGLDLQGLADKISGFLDKLKSYWGALKEAFSGVGTALSDAVGAVRSKLSELTGAFGSAKSVEGFKGVMQGVADAIKAVAGFIEQHAGAIAKIIQWLPAIVIGFKGLKIAKTVAPGISAAASALAKMASAGIGGIAGKLFGISNAQKQVGKSSSGSSKKMLTAAKSYALMGAAVLLISVGFALLAKSAVAVATAGGPAIGVMAGLVVAVAGLGAGMAWMLNNVKAGPKKLQTLTSAFLAMAAAVLLISAGFALLAQSAIALAAAGGPAIAVMAGLVVALAGFMAGMGLLLKMLAPMAAQMTAVGIAFLAMAAAVLLISVSFMLLAQSAIALAAAGTPAILCMLGLVAAIALLAAVFALLAPMLTAGSAGLLAFGAAILMVGAGALLAAAALAVVASVLPVVVQYGASGAAAIAALGASMLAFAGGALAAGAACIVLGAGLLVVGAGLLVVGAGLTLVAAAALLMGAGMVMVGTGAQMAAEGMAALGPAIETVTEGALKKSAKLIALSAGLLAFGAAALVAGAGALMLGAGLTLIGTGLLLIAAGAAAAAQGVLLLSTTIPMIGRMAEPGAEALDKLGAAMLKFAPGAVAAGAACTIMAAGLVLAVATATALSAGLALVAASSGAAAAALRLLTGALPAFSAALAVVPAKMMAFTAQSGTAAAASAAMAAGFLPCAASAIALSAAAITLAAGMAAAAAGTTAMSASVNRVNTGLKKAETSAEKATGSLEKIQSGAQAASSGLQNLESVAGQSMRAIQLAFSRTAQRAKNDGAATGRSYAAGLQASLQTAVSAVRSAMASISAAMQSGYSAAYQAGRQIGLGFANGMESMLGRVRSIAAKFVAVADQVIRAKAQIGSPSRLAAKEGRFFVLGFVNELKNGARLAAEAARELVAAPTATLAGGYSGNLSSEYAYGREIVIEVPLSIDGREFARATASYTQGEINRLQSRDERLHGRV